MDLIHWCDMKQTEPTLLWLFFSFKGRIARQSFALAAGFLLLPQILVIYQIVKAEQADNEGALAFWGLTFIVFAILALWSLFALFIKRLHDLSLPGALAILSFISGVNLLFFAFLALMPSKRETNQHGPPPFAD